jgi:hypothetical protein
MHVVVKTIGMEMHYMTIGVRLYNALAAIRRLVIEKDVLADKVVVVSKHERQHAFFVPADGVVMYYDVVVISQSFSKPQHTAQAPVEQQLQADA